MDDVRLKCIACSKEFTLKDKDTKVCDDCIIIWREHAKQVEKIIKECTSCNQLFIETNELNKCTCNNCIKK